MLYGGIDEAGYGPMLGPLCVGSALFEVDHAGAGRPCLWSTLDAAVTRAGRDKAGRIAIDDSKKLKGSAKAAAHPLRRLERGVLTMLAAVHEDRSWLGHCTDVDVLERLGVHVPDEPWFGGEPIAMPLGIDTGLLRLDAASLVRAMDEAAVSIHHLQVRALSVPEYNRRVTGSGSKSWVNFEVATQSLEQIRLAHPGTVHMVMDRHGGRTSYHRSLATAWPQATVETIAQNDTRAHYTIAHGASRLELHIRAKADADHLPVALASMAAKLVRELLMQRLNRFFGEKLPDLAPTAGYVQDGRRWLQEVDPVLRSHQFEAEQLVRCR